MSIALDIQPTSFNTQTFKIRHNFIQPKAKGFIKDIFKQQYNAEISAKYPYIATITNNDEIICAAGLRYAKRETLFLEQYTDQKIEIIANTERSKIVEIGNLAVIDYTKLFKLLCDISTQLLSEGVEFVCITGTQQLLKILNKRGIKGQIIANAFEQNLTSKDESWGTYYDTNPQVCLFNIEENIEMLEKLSNQFNKN